MMRLLSLNGFVEEARPREYLPTAIIPGDEQSKFGIPIPRGPPPHLEIPEYLRAINYHNPDDSMYAPLQYSHNVEVDGFIWLCQNPAALMRFNSYMEGQCANYPFWCGGFPVQERILNHAGLNPKKPLLVDIGGGRGHDLIHFREQFPNAPRTLILEELPSVCDEVCAVRDMDAVGVETLGHDFFAKKPIYGARAYCFKHVLHD